MADWGKIWHRGRVEDRRGLSPVGLGGVSLATVAMIAVFTLLSGGSPGDILLNVLNNVPANVQTADPRLYEGEDVYEIFASTVLGSNNAHWETQFSRSGQTYTEPKLVLFRAATESACGYADSRVGPHYCPLDQTIYLDEIFFDELTRQFGARGGDVAEAYVIAHEVGHHAQHLLGGLDAATNAESIAVELQADCFAGLWAHSVRDRGVFEPGEIQEAMDAAAAVGDDRIQASVTGQVNPESWTHGSSAQRVEWFNRGYESGFFSACTLR